MTSNAIMDALFCVISPNSLALGTNYVKVVKVICMQNVDQRI